MPRVPGAVSLGTPDASILVRDYSYIPPLIGEVGLYVSDLTGDLGRADPGGPHGGA